MCGCVSPEHLLGALGCDPDRLHSDPDIVSHLDGIDRRVLEGFIEDEFGATEVAVHGLSDQAEGILCNGDLRDRSIPRMLAAAEGQPSPDKSLQFCQPWFLQLFAVAPHASPGKVGAQVLMCTDQEAATGCLRPIDQFPAMPPIEPLGFVEQPNRGCGHNRGGDRHGSEGDIGEVGGTIGLSTQDAVARLKPGALAVPLLADELEDWIGQGDPAFSSPQWSLRLGVQQSGQEFLIEESAERVSGETQLLPDPPRRWRLPVWMAWGLR